MGTFNTIPWNGGGAGANPANGISLSDLANDALNDLGCLRPGQVGTDDMLQSCRRSANQMLDSWLIDAMIVSAAIGSIIPLTIGKGSYMAGPGGDIDPRPTAILGANLILNQFTPTTRVPLFSTTNVQYWESIIVRDISASQPQILYYDKGFDEAGSGAVNLWPPPDKTYGLEIFTCSQLQQFADLTTQYLFPPGYALMIRKNLAVQIEPSMRVYRKLANLDMRQLEADARKSKADVMSYNAPAPLLAPDPAFSGRRHGGWNYLTGEHGWGGR